jgi:hypothetical protein
MCTSDWLLQFLITLITQLHVQCSCSTICFVLVLLLLLLLLLLLVTRKLAPSLEAAFPRALECLT